MILWQRFQVGTAYGAGGQQLWSHSKPASALLPGGGRRWCLIPSLLAAFFAGRCKGHLCSPCDSCEMNFCSPSLQRGDHRTTPCAPSHSRLSEMSLYSTSFKNTGQQQWVSPIGAEKFSAVADKDYIKIKLIKTSAPLVSRNFPGCEEQYNSYLTCRNEEFACACAQQGTGNISIRPAPQYFCVCWYFPVSGCVDH